MDLTSREIKIVLNSMVFYLLALKRSSPYQKQTLLVWVITLQLKTAVSLDTVITVLDPLVIHRGELVLVDK